MWAGTSASGDTVLLPAEALKPDFRASCGGAGEIRESLWPSMGWLVSSLQFINSANIEALATASGFPGWLDLSRTWVEPQLCARPL